MISIVIGALFGDEGKGMTVDWLVKRKENPIVVRFGSGHQCGHRVVHKDKEHIFSNFGSGTLRGAPTYWSKDCTIDPVGFMKEYNVLKSKGITPTIYASPECMITTPWDIAHNHFSEDVLHHGSTGTGYGATIARNEGTQKLRLIELRSDSIMNHKINTYFKSDTSVEQVQMLNFENACKNILDVISIIPEYLFFGSRDTTDYIFEGNQGILLDHEYGFFPHVTRGNTMSRGAERIVKMIGDIPTIYYVTRAYGTRHGNGPLPGEKYSKHLELKNTKGEANADHEWQGKFRTAPMDIDTLQYAISIDRYTKGFPTHSDQLVVTCCDHIDKKNLPVIIGDTFYRKDIDVFNTLIKGNVWNFGSPTWSSEN